MTYRRHALVLSVLAAALLPAAPSHAIAGEQASAVRDVTRDVSRAVTRYQRGRNENRFEQTARETRTVKVGANGSIELHNIAGDIVVTAGGGDTATIDILKTSRGSSDADARELLGLVPVEIIER